MLTQILADFLVARKRLYIKRKEDQIEKITKQCERLETEYRFLELVNTGEIDFCNSSFDQVLTKLREHGFKRDGVNNNYDYLVKTPLVNLTDEKASRVKQSLEQVSSAFYPLSVCCKWGKGDGQAGRASASFFSSKYGPFWYFSAGEKRKVGAGRHRSNDDVPKGPGGVTTSDPRRIETGRMSAYLHTRGDVGDGRAPHSTPGKVEPSQIHEQEAAANIPFPTEDASEEEQEQCVVAKQLKTCQRNRKEMPTGKDSHDQNRANIDLKG